MTPQQLPGSPGRDWIAMVLAIGLATAMNLFCIAVLWDALINDEQAGLSENATQVLTGWGGGIIGVLGAVFGYKAGQAQQDNGRRGPDAGE